VAHYCARHRPDRVVVYQTVEGYLDELAKALQKGGGQDAMRERYVTLDVLLLDDVQFLTGQPQAQEMLLRTLDALTGRGAQIVLASDRPPAEINGLDARLLSRFSGGLIVDIGAPDYETRVAIMRRKAEERSQILSPGVAEALARFPFKNVRQLGGALNRLLAVQELEGRTVELADLPGLAGEEMSQGTDLVQLLGVIGTGVAAQAPAAGSEDEPRWRREVRAVAATAEADGFSTHRITRLLAETVEPEGWQASLKGFLADLDVARSMKGELDALGNPWPEAAATLLRDPDRLDEAQSLLASARERARPFARIPSGPELEELKGKYPALALRAAARILKAERPDYNPLYVYSSDPDRASALLEATARTFLATRPTGRVALVSVPEFAEEFIRAISDGVAGAWRERWWSAELLLLYGIEGLSRTERAQEEFFHLFEALIRRGARIVLAADRAPSRVEGVDDRLLSRFEGGLVVELGPGSGSPRAARGAAEGVRAPNTTEREVVSASGPGPAGGPGENSGGAPGSAPQSGPEREGAPASSSPAVDDLAAVREIAGVTRGRPREGRRKEGEEELVVAAPPPSGASEWFPARDKVVWDWPVLDDLLVDEE
jgi:chromosomal replication initiation ATPase DnaA